MAIGGGLSTARSGLINSNAALGVIGNNIANVSTIGFKGSRTEFEDLISASAGGQIGKIGLGSKIGAVRTIFTQGAVESTGRALDLAIDGQGFFVLREGLQGQAYTRAGNFQLTADGLITNTVGDVLQGTPVNPDGTIAGGVGDVSVQGLTGQAKATQNATLVGNLKADDTVNPAPFDGTSFQSAFSTSNFPYTIKVYDSRGGAHDLSIFFKKTSTANQWQVFMGVDKFDETGVAADKGKLDIVNGAGDTLTFGTDGSLASETAMQATISFNGAAPGQVIKLNVGTIGKADGLGQFANDSGLSFVSQDGFSAGGLVSLTVDAKGFLTATFDNGQTRALFQLAIAQFKAPEGLDPAGNGVYRQSIDSGPPAIATAGSQGNGTIASSALEQSNVEIAQEFINLITQQRAFQANARVITASDQLLNDLINIVR